MGIPGLDGQYLQKLKINIDDFPLGTFPDNISGVLIDLNDIIHFCAQMTYLYGWSGWGFSPTPKQQKFMNSKSDAQLEKIFIDKIINRIEMYLEELEPEDYFIVAVDGPVPLCKIAQQRLRRIGAGESVSSPRFDHNVISPGTEIMEKIHLRIKKWFYDKASNDKLPRFSCYSSHHEPGEGEHKMIKILRDHHEEIYGAGQPKGMHLICGQDTDLVMIATLFPYKHAAWNKEDRGKEAKSGSPEGNLKMIDPFKDIIYRTLRRDNSEIDFVLTYFTFGNDFMPKNIALRSASQTVDDIASAYIQNSKRLVDLRTCKINRKYFLRFLSFFSKIEEENINLFASTYNPDKQGPFDVLMKNYKRSPNNKKLVDMVGFKQDWYERAFKTYNENALEGKEYTCIETFMRDMFENYLEMLQWNLDYYLGKEVAWNFQYKFIFSPMLSDVANLPQEGDILRNVDEWKGEASILRQLIMISHPSKIRKFIPPTFYPILDNPIIKKLTPNKAITLVEGNYIGKQHEHHYMKILPIVYQDVYEDIISKYTKTVPSRMEVNHNPADIFIKEKKSEIIELEIKDDVRERTSEERPKSSTKIMTYEKFTWTEEEIK